MNVNKSLYLTLALLMLVYILFSFQEKPPPYIQIGEASYYARLFEDKMTASGTPYKGDSLTAAHRTLPFGTVIKVTNLENHKKVIVEINDRGPFLPDRVLDLSRAAAKKLGMIRKGTAEIKLEVIEPAKGYSITDSVAVK